MTQIAGKMDFEKAGKTRISVLFFGALLARVKNFKMPPPGGDRIGLRPISVQLKALEKLKNKWKMIQIVIKIKKIL